MAFLVGGGIALIALFVLYQQGKADRDQIEEELNQMPEQEQAFWRPVIDNPELLQERVKELLDVA